MNYNEIETKYSLGNMSFNVNYLKENKISDEKEYVKSSIEIKQGKMACLHLIIKKHYYQCIGIL